MVYLWSFKGYLLQNEIHFSKEVDVLTTTSLVKMFKLVGLNQKFTEVYTGKFSVLIEELSK